MHTNSMLWTHSTSGLKMSWTLPLRFGITTDTDLNCKVESFLAKIKREIKVSEGQDIGGWFSLKLFQNNSFYKTAVLKKHYSDLE